MWIQPSPSKIAAAKISRSRSLNSSIILTNNNISLEYINTYGHGVMTYLRHSDQHHALLSTKKPQNRIKMVNLNSLVETFGDSKSEKDQKKRKRKAILLLAIYLVTTAGFLMFIVEESLQMYNFGVMGLAMNKDYDMLREELPRYQAFHDHCQRIMYILYVFNPPTGYYFQTFLDADQHKVDIWKRQVERHDSRFREVVAGEVRGVHTNGDGTAVVAIDTGSVVENIYVPFPEVTAMPREGDMVQCECTSKYVRGAYRLELVRMSV